jgi:hypothetical protein
MRPEVLMTTVYSDDLLLGGAPLVSKYSIRDHLARGFDADEEYFIYEGRPHAGWPELDLIYNFGCDPPREAHPFLPVWRGQKVTETEFRRVVRAVHGIDET